MSRHSGTVTIVIEIFRFPLGLSIGRESQSDRRPSISRILIGDRGPEIRWWRGLSCRRVRGGAPRRARDSRNLGTGTLAKRKVIQIRTGGAVDQEESWANGQGDGLCVMGSASCWSSPCEPIGEPSLVSYIMPLLSFPLPHPSLVLSRLRSSILLQFFSFLFLGNIVVLFMIIVLTPQQVSY